LHLLALIGKMTSSDIYIVKLGYHDRANLLPLLYPLQAGWTAPASPWKLEVVNAILSELVQRLLQGELDAAFVPPAAVQQHGRDFSPLEGWGLASEGATETALLLAPRRLDMMDGADVALTPEAQGSTAEHLLRMLLKPYYDINLSLRSPGVAGYNPRGARLMYSDDAAKQAQKRGKDWVAEDLGVAAFVWSGLPVVWEMLAVRRDLEEHKPDATDVLQTLIRQSQRTAQEQLASVLGEASKRLGLEQGRVKELFGRQTYILGQDEQKGLARFLDAAARMRLGEEREKG
jgi:chorismate dehydratase